MSLTDGGKLRNGSHGSGERFYPQRSNEFRYRGAGNLLGAEQSGFIMDMGYETYQKILSEAMEELGVETGMTAAKTSGSFMVESTIETDQVALIPDSYIDITAEKIRIYKQLDGMTSEKEMELVKERLTLFKILGTIVFTR